MSYKLWAQTPRPQDRKLFKTSIEQKTQTGGAFPGIKPEDIGSEDRLRLHCAVRTQHTNSHIFG